MAFENSQAFVMESKKMVGSEQFESLCRIDVLAEKPIKKIVHISARPKIVSSEKVGENLDFTGRTAYTVVYETEEGAIASVETVIDWQNKTVCDIDNYYICPKIVENTVSGFSANEVAISSLVNIEVYGVKQEKVLPITNLEEYVVNEKSYEYQKLVNSVKETFNEVLELEHSGKIEEVLYSKGEILLKNATAGIDNVCVEGELEIIVYGLENGRIVELTKTAEFKHEFGALSVVPNNMVDAVISLDSLKVSASINETDNKTNLIMSIENKVYALIYSKEFLSVVEDAFSTKKETNATYECVSMDTFDGQGRFTDTAVGSFDVDKELFEICFALETKSVISEVKKEQDSTKVIGATFVDLVCETESREKVKVQGVVPFAISSNEIDKDDFVEIKSKVTSCKLRGQKEIEAVIEYDVQYKKMKNVCVNYLSQIEETGESKDSLSAIKVYVVKENEDLFSVAKAMLTSPEIITAQNLGIEEELREGMRVVVYNGLDISF
ncbi:MAG: hypothetical protein IKC11_04225 [Clostridia bacterium]|nr:hypothetical protein [Clostridia bacterium]